MATAAPVVVGRRNGRATKTAAKADDCGMRRTNSMEKQRNDGVCAVGHSVVEPGTARKTTDRNSYRGVRGGPRSERSRSGRSRGERSKSEERTNEE
ncbi:hypothetical protein [Haladaptatus salinisoli]|uniref:hypothetical protein n=1 Tax=Haladaptatus salinisoli TaxID=2884876 RepID=UPI001D0BE3C8|nr:hypothetical protein [Haladaptatus salinisoli]